MKDNKKDNPKNRQNWQQSFTHQKTPNRVAPRMSGFQKNKGTQGMRKGSR